MIRPVTAVCLLMAGASGLYLYQTKHRTFMLDRQIEQTIRETAATRERSNMLRADWALLNDTTRLSDLAARHLSLHQTSPSQFVTMAEFDHRLPPVRAGKPDGTPAVAASVPMARTTPPAVLAPPSVQQASAQPVPAAPVAAPSHPPRPAAVVVAAALPTVPMPVPTPAVATPAAPSPPAAPATIAQARPIPRTAVATVEKHEAEIPRDFAKTEFAKTEFAKTEFAKTEPAAAPVIHPVITQAMATAVPRPVPVARTPSYVPHLASALGETSGRLPRPEPMAAPMPVMVSSLGSGGRPLLAPPVPMPTNSAPSQVR